MDLDARNLTDLQGYIDYLEANNLLIRVKTEVDAEFELAGIAKRFDYILIFRERYFYFKAFFVGHGIVKNVNAIDGNSSTFYT